MIAHQYKLTTKEVNYLLRRKQAIYIGEYKILWCAQYPNNLYHQTGIQVSSKVHKSSVQRNIIRRAWYAARQNMIDKAVHNHYYKIFIIIHPEHCDSIKHILEAPWDLLKPKTHSQLMHHFSQIISSIPWKLNQQTSKISSPKPNSSGAKSNAGQQ